MIRRLTKEVAALQRGDLSGLGIYTVFDEANIRQGRAMILGPEDSPYAFCPLVFTISVPEDYPLSPPAVKIDTSDGITRIHPNLYVHGKVCLSILGTYSGPNWVSTMNLETVLKSIFSLLNDNPIVNEPGWERYTLADPVAKGYADTVEFAMARMTLATWRAFQAGLPTLWEPFRDVIEGPWQAALARLRDSVRARADEGPKTYTGLPYMVNGSFDWSTLTG